MRKSLLIIIFCFLATPIYLYAQRFGGGVVLGLNISQIDGDFWSGYNKAGGVGGAFVTTEFRDNWGAQMEIRYAAKGAAQSWRVVAPRKIRLQYIELPLLLTYTFYRDFQAQTGVSLGYLFSSAQNDGDGYIEFEQFETYEIAFNLGLDYKILDKLSVNVRYAYSILPTDAYYSGASFPYATFNNVITFGLYYHISR
jgi:outer membrane protein W